MDICIFVFSACILRTRWICALLYNNKLFLSWKCLGKSSVLYCNLPFTLRHCCCSSHASSTESYVILLLYGIFMEALKTSGTKVAAMGCAR